MPGVHHLEQVAETADVLRRAQEQEPLGVERVVQQRHDALLEGGVHVDQHVAAADQVEAAERRVGGQVVPGEDAQLADRLADLVVAVRADEEPPQPLGGDVDLDVVEVDAGAGLLQGRLVQVGGQDLDGGMLVRRFEVLQQADGQRVDLLAGGSSRRPRCGWVSRRDGPW